MERYFKSTRALAPLLATLLAACASTGPAPVEDLSVGAQQRTAAIPPVERRPSGPSADTYRVQRGDTLYSIAFRHGIDYRELAGWNGIAAPYTIYVGQDLRVTGTARPATAAPSAVATHPSPPPAPTNTSTVAASAKPATPAPSAPKPAPFETVTAQSTSTGAAPAPVSTKAPAPPPSVVTTQASEPPPAALPVPAKPAATPAPPAAPSSSASAVSGDVVWHWPADGQVVGSYVGGDQTRQGIDIAGKAGDPVRAAADGAVVYSGNGLIGYGELIIVKHSPGFLSAYGHNRKRLVKEGDHVKAGQTIAEMGSSSANRDSLHFEIRKNGKPANPIDYLPRR
jgi:lipoprotein NlpD